MTTQVTLSRSGTSVAIDLLRRGNDLAIARDTGKPQLNFPTSATLDPKAQDHRSAADRFTVLGMLLGPGAYSRATALADLVKAHSAGEPLQFDATAVTGFDQVYQVGVPSDRALELDYQPGVRDRVDVQLSLPVVSETKG